MQSRELEIKLKEKGIKQKWLAEKLNVSPAMISYWVKGQYQIPEIKKEHLKKLLA